MTEINSATNQRVKKFAFLKTKKGRRESGFFIVEGARIVRDAFGRDVEMTALLLCRGCEQEYGDEIAVAEGKGIEVILFSESAFSKISDTETSQGIIAVITLPSPKAAVPTGDCLILDRVSDSGNLGAIIRTAAACGFCDVYLVDCADAFSPKAVRATMGGIFCVRIYDVTAEEATELCSGCVRVVADMGGANVFSEGVAFGVDAKVCLIMGSEAFGVSGELRKTADRVLSLPMAEGSVESLNVAVSCGILAYELAKRRMK